MNERTKTGIEILQVAAILGVLGDVLLRATPWGLNVLLFNAAFAAGMIMLLRRHAPEYLMRQTWALFGALIFFASMFVWRDSIELRVADTVAIVVILSVLFVPKMKVATQVAGDERRQHEAEAPHQAGREHPSLVRNLEPATREGVGGVGDPHVPGADEGGGIGRRRRLGEGGGEDQAQGHVEGSFERGSMISQIGEERIGNRAGEERA
mgnify:CR=1 FL=1